MTKIYLIEKTWIDNLENNNAWGYSHIGFVETEEEAIKIVEEGGKHKKGDCWQINVHIRCGILKEFPNKYRYEEVANMKEQIQ